MSLSTVIAFIKVIPALKSWFDFLVAEWVRSEVSRMKKENREAIRVAIEEQDQRELERAIGSSRPGKPTGHDGAVIVDTLPGVGMPPHKAGDRGGGLVK